MQAGNEYFSYNNDNDEDIIREGIDSNEKNGHEENSLLENIESISKDAQGEALTENDGHHEQERFNASAIDMSSELKPEEEKKSASQTSSDEQKAKSVPTGEIPLVERLPSRNVTFQSATILTVPELSSCIYASTKAKACSSEEEAQCIFENKPLTDVRVTGVVQQIVITNDAQGNQKSFVVLGDALFVAPKRQTGTLNRNRYQSFSKKNTSFSKLHMTPKKINTTAQRNLKTPSSSTSTLSMKTPQTFSTQKTPSTNTQPKAMIGTSLSGKKRRLVTVKPKVHNSLLNRKNIATPLNPIRPNTLKSRMNSTRIDRRQQELVQKVKQGMHIIIVDVTDTTLEGCKVDDLIMIMGSIACTPLPNEESGRYNMLSALGVIQSNYAHSTRESEKDSKDTCTKGDTLDGKKQEAMHKMGMYVQARILQVVNGTDMNLLQKALELRRKHVENTYNTS
ncbi:hypothetical protein CTEN210_09848 [Chaetoceros tenuissimus]|nr:hypothetical protein CTEN210_09848 [Chaetoceros tenuissimus]